MNPNEPGYQAASKSAHRADPGAPWFRHFWVWVIIAIPMTAVVLGGVLVYFSITQPDPLVINSEQYDAIVRGLRAQDEQSMTQGQPAKKPGDPDRVETTHE